jgi:hypothetical protein
LEEWTWENSATILDAIFDRLRSEQLNNRDRSRRGDADLETTR